jgi:hypothetical protein
MRADTTHSPLGGAGCPWAGRGVELMGEKRSGTPCRAKRNFTATEKYAESRKEK